MSNIFNLLGGIAEPDKSQMVKPITRSKTSYEIRPNTYKSMGDRKLKGLSMRSNSDMNVSHNVHPVGIKKAIHNNSEQDSLKLKVTQTDNNGRPISPGKGALSKKLIAQPIKYKEQVLQAETVVDKSTKTQKILSNDVFKKPLPLKRFIKRFPETESLAHYHEDQYEFDHGYIDAIEREFNDLLMKRKENIVPYEERGFTSDPETMISPEIPEVILPSLDQEYMELSSPELPQISDDEL